MLSVVAVGRRRRLTRVVKKAQHFPKCFAGSCPRITLRYNPGMATIAEVEKLALDLSDSERAILASHLLRSLPPVLQDEDEGLAEALRRDAELDANPEAGITLDQLDQRISDRRR